MAFYEERMNNIPDTLNDLNKAGKNAGIKFLLTRYEPKTNDLDVCVEREEFSSFIQALEELGYKASLHDQVLGGRIKGEQRNLIKEDRIKIDLHKDFTWRKARYLDLSNIWDNTENKKVLGIGVNVPKDSLNIFLIFINIVFEKTYFSESEIKLIKSQLNAWKRDPLFLSQAKKYGWRSTCVVSMRWVENFSGRTYPAFLPVWVVLWSYLEKLLHDKEIDLKSLTYYLYFRIRYAVNGILPYE